MSSDEEQESEQIGNYEILHPIGRGSFGDVKCAKRIPSGRSSDELYALKICSRSQLKKIKLCEYDLHGDLLRYTGVQRFERECAILETLRHPHIAQFCEVFHDDEEDLLVLATVYYPLGPVLRFEEASQRYVYNAALVALHQGVFGIESVLAYFRDLVQAVSYLHKNNICHRDIKPANILLSHNTTHTNTHNTTRPTSTARPYKLVLCDFGAAEQFDSLLNPLGLVSNTTGSPADWAPEAVFPEKYVTDVGLDLSSEIPDKVVPGDDSDINEDNSGTKVHRFSAYGLDMWCMGVVLFELFCLKHPFYSTELSEIDLYERIDTYDPMLFTTHTTGLYSDTLHATNDTIHDTATTTTTTTTVHPPDPECTAILEGLLQKDPTLRWSVDTLMELSVFM